MTYDFMTLSPEDFEALVADLLSREWGAQLEVFKPGKDGGIDLRHSRVPANNPKTIVQCRRYAPHKYGELERSLAKEVGKLEQLCPERYVLATSVNLSPANKEALIAELYPWCSGPENIFGPHELNALLRKHEDVQRTHFKLWMSGTAVLERILHSRIFNITDATVDSVKSQLSRLVMHDGFERARKLLQEQHHCVIAGNPGIGKTTVARMLMCHYLEDGYTPLVVIGDVSDAWEIVTRAASSSQKYVVLYDDFLGTFRFDEAKFEKNEDTALMSFVEKARSSPNLRFILTTREYILADARRLHGTFERQADHLAKCTILIEDYAKANRARVLFNHLYFSDLSESRLQRLVAHQVYRDIVGHEHFNPRIVETISVQANSASLSDDEYCDYVRKKFDDPSDLWAHPFEHQISPTAREILVLLWSFSGSVELGILKEAIIAFCHPEPSASIALKFRSALKELTGNFIACNRYERAAAPNQFITLVTFQNPSVEEFIERFLAGETTWSDALAQSVTHFAQVERLFPWATTKGRGGRSVTVSDNFLCMLHNRAVQGERRNLGKLFTFVGSPALKYMEFDLRNDAARTHILLKIAIAADAADSRAQEIWSRVTTTEGWEMLLSEATEWGTVAYSVRRLIEWIHGQVEYETERQMCATSYQTAMTALLFGPKPWNAGLRSLEEYRLCLRLLGMELSREHNDAIERLAVQSVQDILHHEKDPQRMDDQVSALKELAASIHFPAVTLLDSLEKRSIELRKAEATGSVTNPSQTYAASSQADETVDLDEMFASLLDR